MASSNIARLGVILGINVAEWEADINQAIAANVKLKNAIKKENTAAEKEIERLSWAIKDYGREVSNAEKIERDFLTGGKFANATELRKQKLREMAAQYDAVAAAAKKADTAQAGGLNAQQKAALGYQTTDIITSLAGGQNPMLVLIQQGGQLRDQFGGFGALFKGIAEAVTLSAVAYTTLGVALGAVAYATYKGNEELKLFNNQLILSGNLANQTYDKYIKASRALAESQVVSIKTAKEAYGAVAASGQFTEKSILSVSTAITAFARTAGVSGVEAAQKLIPAFSGGAKSILELNKEFNFLNASQVAFLNNATMFPDRIKSIQIASEALTKHLEESKDNIGYFEKIAKYASDLFQTFKEWGADNDVKKLSKLNEEILQLKKNMEIPTGKVNRNQDIFTFRSKDSEAFKIMEKELKEKQAKADALDKLISDREEKSRKDAEEKARIAKKQKDLGESGGPEKGVQKDFERERANIQLKFQDAIKFADELQKIEAESERDIALIKLSTREKDFQEKSYWTSKNADFEILEIDRVNAEAAKKLIDSLKTGNAKSFELEQLREKNKFELAVYNLDKFKRIDLEATRDINIKKAEIDKKNLDEKNLYKQKNDELFTEYEKGRYAKAEADKAEISRQAYEEVRKNIQDQQNLVNLDKEKLAIYEKNLFISEADYKIALLKLDTEQQIQKIRDNPNLSREDQLKAIQMQMELQKSKIAVNELDERLKLLKDSGALVFKSLEDAIIQFTRTGKLSFKDLVGTVLRGLLEMQIRAQSTKLFSMLGSMLFATPRADLIGANAVLGTNQNLDSFDLPQRAMGGSVAANDSYIVGENGPEMFVPRQSGTIVPNGQLSSMGNQPQVIYNGPYIASMSAIDTQSATQFLARNKNAVWSANQSASRGLPTNR